jgi:hypothetical protein
MSKIFLISETEKQEILSIYQNKGILVEQDISHWGMSMAAPINPLQTARYVKDATLDDWINLTSAALDVIPGIGWVASGIIDIGHSLMYAAKYYNSTTDEDKFKNAASAIFTIGMAFIPVGGNIANIIASKGINNAIKNFTPAVVKKILGLPVGFNFSKVAWKYSLYAFLLKYTESKIDDLLYSIKSKVEKLLNSSIPEIVKSFMSNFQYLINELLGIYEEVKNNGNPNYQQINQYLE